MFFASMVFIKAIYLSLEYLLDPQEVRQSKHNLAGVASSKEPIDWRFAQNELYQCQGIDLKQEMDKKIVEIEQQFRKEMEQMEREHKRRNNVKS